MKRTRRWLALLLAGVLTIPQAAVLRAEELTDGAQTSVKEMITGESGFAESGFTESEFAESGFAESELEESGLAESGLTEDQDGNEEIEIEEIGLADEGLPEELPEILSPGEKPAQAGATVGSCGPTAEWEVDDNGVLTITGTGELYDDSPWMTYVGQIKTVIISSGITSIGNNAFLECRDLKSITIPDTVTSIGRNAFGNCSSLTSVSLPKNLKSVGENLFSYCTSLTSVTIPDGLTEIAHGMFWGCTKLPGVTIPKSVKKIGGVAFFHCESMNSILIPDGVTSIGDEAFAFSGVKAVFFPGHAPAFEIHAWKEANESSMVFDGVTAKAYYPKGDSTWTASVRQNYGGTITWIALAKDASGNLIMPEPGVIPDTAPVITGYYNSSKGGDIRWTKVEGADGYVLFRNRKADGLKEAARIYDPDTLQYIDGAIKDNCWGRVYTYYVQPLFGDKMGKKSNVVTLQRLAPMKFTKYVNSAAGKVDLTWTCTVKENKALGYEVQYAASTADLYGQKGTFKKVSVEGRNNLSKTISGLSKGKTYWFRIRCYVNYTHSVTGKVTKTWSQYSDVVSVKINR